MLKPKEQRVEVLIDVQNLYHSARNLYGARVNFKEILKQAISSRKFIRAFAYVVRTKTGEEKAFLEALTRLGIETREREGYASPEDERYKYIQKLRRKLND